VSFLPPLPPTFEAALRDVDATRPDFRVAAARRLASAADDEEARLAADALRRACLDADAAVREAALLSAAQLAREDLVSAAEGALGDPHPLVRRAAAVALGEIGGPRALALLGAAARSPHWEARADAALGASCLADPAVAPLLLPLLEDPYAEVRALAAEALGELGDPSHAAALLPLLRDADAAVVRGAARALGRLGDARAVSALRELLRDPESRFEAVELLGTLEAEEAREDLARLAGRRLTPLLLRAAAGGALARMGDPRGVSALRAVLRAVRDDGRGLAVELVGRLGLHALRPELERLRRRPRGVDPAELARALDRLAVGSPSPDASPAASPGLLSMRAPRNGSS